MPKESLEQQLMKSFLWLERLKPESQEVISIQLAKAQKEIIVLVGSSKSQAQIKKEINEILTRAFATFETVFIEDKAEITTLAYNATQNIMAGFTTIEPIKFNDIKESTKKRLLSNTVRIQGNTLDNHLKHLDRITTRKIQGQIVQGFENGLGIRNITTNIKNSFDLLENSQLNSVVRTSLLESIRHSQNEVMDHFKDEIEEYYYNSALDTRTTPRCFNLNGTSSKRKEDITKLLNFHYNCRSILGVRTELSKQLEDEQNVTQWDESRIEPRQAKNGLYRIGRGKAIHRTPEAALTWYRANVGNIETKFSVDNVKKIPRNASPETAFKSFDIDHQIKYMGKTRYELWSSGKASFDQMIRKTRNDFLPVATIKKNLGL